MTETVDFDKLQAATGPAVDFAHLLVAVRGTGTSAVIAGFSSMDSLFVEARALPNDHSHGSSTLTLLVEQSSDGISWSTAATLTFTGDSTQTDTITSPEDRLRVSWSVAGTAQWNVPTMLIVPPAGGGSGGSMPAEWTVAIEDDRNLRYEVGGADGVLQLQKGTDANTGVILSVAESVDSVDTRVQIETVGAEGTAILSIWNHDDPDGAIAVLDGRGYINFFTVAGNKAIEAWDAAGNTLRFALLPAGQVMIGVLAAPADGDLSAGQVALWFDDTDGAAKLKIKGKSANGSVVTGQVALS